MHSKEPLDEAHLPEIMDGIISSLEFKENGSFLVLGGGEWCIGQKLESKIGASTFLFADDDKGAIKDAEDADVFCTDVESMCDASEIAKLGKFDGILIKNMFEFHAAVVLSELLEACWKLLKLNAKLVFVFRRSPPFPCPAGLKERWEAQVPTQEALAEAAKNEDATFEISEKILDFPKSTLRTPALKEILKAYCCDDNEVNSVLSEIGEAGTEFDDRVEIIALTKVID